ncbi:unnamed protein product, partial [marine sediment metagenome]
VSASQIYPTLVRASNLVILGETVMDWQDDYNDLSQLLVAAADEFEQVTGKTKYVLDFEYKKLAAGGAAMPAGGLVVKQIREIPQPDDTPSITTPFLVNEPMEYCTFQGEYGNVFANHRLKLRWTLETKNLWLTPENLEQSFYADAYIEYATGGRIRILSGTPSLWPFSNYTFDGTNAIDGWLMHHLANPRTCELHTNNVPTQVAPTESPVVTLLDFGIRYWADNCLKVRVEYAQPVLSWDWTGPTTTTTDEIRLCPCMQPQAGDLLQERSFDGPNGVSISTSYYWPPPPGTYFFTYPLARFVILSALLVLFRGLQNGSA